MSLTPTTHFRKEPGGVSIAGSYQVTACAGYVSGDLLSLGLSLLIHQSLFSYLHCRCAGPYFAPDLVS